MKTLCFNSKNFICCHGFIRDSHIKTILKNICPEYYKNLFSNMVLDLIIKNTDDGYTAEVPSINGCECWAHDEDTVINKILDLSSFYLDVDVKKIKLDKAHGTKKKQIYKLIFDKSN